jgi:hypothetical protein
VYNYIHVLKGGQLMESLLNKKVLESALNAFVIALVTQFTASGADITVLTGDALGTILNSAVSAAAWVVIRAVNPKDTKFGIGAKLEVASKAKKK